MLLVDVQEIVVFALYAIALCAGVMVTAGAVELLGGVVELFAGGALSLLADPPPPPPPHAGSTRLIITIANNLARANRIPSVIVFPVSGL